MTQTRQPFAILTKEHILTPATPSLNQVKCDHCGIQYPLSEAKNYPQYDVDSHHLSSSHNGILMTVTNEID